MARISKKVKVGLVTLGCKVNQCESAALAEDLHNKGFALVSFTSSADIYIINTCTVTAFSDFQARQLIRRAYRNNPQAKILITGCYAQIAAEYIAQLDGVSLVVGNKEKNIIPELLQNNSIDSRHIIANDIFHQKDFVHMPITKFRGHTRAFLKIQDGCNSFCSYCIVPFTRGKSRSLAVDEAIKSIINFANRNYKEIVLCGIHLGSYGHDLNPASTLSSLLRKILYQHLNARIRLSSIEPREITDDLLNLFNEQDILCPHLHIPLQSGDNRILALMKRDYDATFYRKLIQKIASTVSDVAIGVDVIVGFPSESEIEFKNTLKLLEDLPIAYLHVFPYSERPNTMALKIQPKVPEKIKKERSLILRNLSAQKRKEFSTRFLGRKLNVLVENIKDKKTGLMKGFSQNYIPVLIEEYISSAKNKIISVQMENIKDGELYGKIVHG